MATYQISGDSSFNGVKTAMGPAFIGFFANGQSIQITHRSMEEARTAIQQMGDTLNLGHLANVYVVSSGNPVLPDTKLSWYQKMLDRVFKWN